MPADAVDNASQELTWQAVGLMLTGFGMVAVGAGLIAGLLYLMSPSLRRRLLPMQRLRWGRWTGFEVLLTFFLFQLAPYLVFGLLTRARFFHAVYGEEPDELRMRLWLSPFYLPLIIVLVLTTLYNLSETTADELGLRGMRWAANFVAGYLAFLVCTLPVLAIQLVFLWLIHVLGGQPAPHPFSNIPALQPTWWEYGLVVFTVCVAAPILEELLYRGILQGWLRRATLLGQMVFMSALCTMSLWPPNATNEETPAIPWGRFTFGMILVAGYTYLLQRLKQQNLFMMEIDFLPPGTAPLPPAPEARDDDEDDDGDDAEGPQETPAQREARQRWQDQDRRQQRQKAILAIYGSAAAFALMHHNWPDPIPLFGLGLVLGWLTFRTQSLLTAITMHALFNLVAVLALLQK